MMKAPQRFKVGDIAKIVSHVHGGLNKITPVRIAKVWKNLVVEVGDIEGTAHRGKLFNPDGGLRGTKNYWSSTRLEPLEDGETAEGILAENKARADKVRVERDLAERERQAEIDAWWQDKGAAIWYEALELPYKFLGEVVRVIRYERRGEARMPLVVVRERKDWKGETEFHAIVGGLAGSEEDNDINTYAQGPITGKTILEVIYQICN